MKGYIPEKSEKEQKTKKTSIKIGEETRVRLIRRKTIAKQSMESVIVNVMDENNELKRKLRKKYEKEGIVEEIKDVENESTND